MIWLVVGVLLLVLLLVLANVIANLSPEQLYQGLKIFGIAMVTLALIGLFVWMIATNRLGPAAATFVATLLFLRKWFGWFGLALAVRRWVQAYFERNRRK